MIKKTLYFGSPAYLSCKNEQLIIDFKEEQLNLDFFVSEEDTEASAWRKRYETRKDLNKTIPVQDIGVIIIDHWGITLSHYLLATLLENNAAVITCSKTHMPTGLLLNLDSNTLQGEKFKRQIEASVPLKKQLWQQTVQEKIKNQAGLLKCKGVEVNNMLKWAKEVKSGDPDNLEARAASFYWKAIFPENIDFYRSRTGPPPNDLLNYGYAILRAITARALAGSGLLPTLGIHHHNKYNAYSLADDVMEPYRPYVDKIVCEITADGTETYELTPKVKKQLLEIASADIFFPSQQSIPPKAGGREKEGSEKSPLMVGMTRTTASLSRCFEGSQNKIIYPNLTPSPSP